MQSEKEFLAEFWGRLASQIAESPFSDRELSKLCGKGPNYINTATRKQADIGVHALYSICELLSLDPSHLFGMAEKVFVADRSPRSETEIVENLLQTAVRLARMRAESDQPPTIDRILDDWRASDQQLRRMHAGVLAYCDVYAPPSDDNTLRLISLGEKGLTAEVLRSRDVDVMNRNLANLEPEVSKRTAEIQREVMTGRYVMVEKSIYTPLLDGKQLSIIYDHLNLLVFDEAGEAQILVYPKYVSQFDPADGQGG